MATKKLYMESTGIPVEGTAGEIRALLVANGARNISEDYDPRGRIIGMHFVLMVHGILKSPSHEEMGICGELPGIQRSIDQLIEYSESLLPKLTALRIARGVTDGMVLLLKQQNPVDGRVCVAHCIGAIWSGCWIFWMQMSSSFPMPAVPEPRSIVWPFEYRDLGRPHDHVRRSHRAWPDDVEPAGRRYQCLGSDG
jgi:hypothetical protein